MRCYSFVNLKISIQKSIQHKIRKKEKDDEKADIRRNMDIVCNLATWAVPL